MTEGGVAEGDAADRGAAKGLRGTALRSAGTNARETQNPGHRLDSRRNSEELSPLRSPEIVFWRTRFLPGFCAPRTYVPAVRKAIAPRSPFAAPRSAAGTSGSGRRRVGGGCGTSGRGRGGGGELLKNGDLSHFWGGFCGGSGRKLAIFLGLEYDRGTHIT